MAKNKRINLDTWTPVDPGNPLGSLASVVGDHLDAVEAKINQSAIGAMNSKTYFPASNVSGITTAGQVITSTTFTATGNPVFILVTGDANPVVPGWIRLQLYRNGVAIGKIVQAESANANVNVPYSLHVIDTPPAGTHTYSMQMQSGAGGNWQFGEGDPPTMSIIELTGAQGPAGVGIKGFTSGYVDAGTFLTLDNIKVSVTTGGSRGLCMATVSGTMTCSISGHYMYAASSPSGTATAYPGANYSTTPSGSFFGWSFGNAGDTSIYIINDYTNQKCYRVTLMIGASYLKNFISIERLV